MADTDPDETLALLARLSQKPGVQSTLILSRESGAIVRTSGLISKTRSAAPSNTLLSSVGDASDGYTNGQGEGGLHTAEEVARLVSAFVGAAGKMIDRLEHHDELRLLRIRTKKNELVIVPNTKYLLVVIHDTPPA